MSEPKLLRVPSKFHSVDDLLETAKKMNLTSVLLLSQRENGNIVFLDTDLTVSEANWLVDQCKMILLGEIRHVDS